MDKEGRSQDRREEEEPCVIPGCKNPTGFRKGTPIDFRENYVEGAGQLCPACFKEIYPD